METRWYYSSLLKEVIEMEFERIHVNSDDVNLSKRRVSKQFLRSLNLRLFDMIASLSFIIKQMQQEKGRNLQDRETAKNGDAKKTNQTNGEEGDSEVV